MHLTTKEKDCFRARVRLSSFFPLREMDDAFFILLATPILGRHENPNGHGSKDHFRYFFGVSALVCAVSWELLKEHNLLPSSAEPIHLLWACAFLRQYLKEMVLETILGRTMKTIRHHMWPVIGALGELGHVLVS